VTSSVYSGTIPTSAGHYVYRLWAADGTCLYVGCTGERGTRRVSDRLYGHRCQKPWWPEVARIDVAAFATPAEIITEERRQIGELGPVHNKALLGRCSNGHDVTAPGARNDGGRCVQCVRDYDKARLASPQEKRRRAETRRKWRRTPHGKARTAAIARRYYWRRKISSDQPALW